jgi:hypothetical protein
MADDGSVYRMCGKVYTYDGLRKVSEPELAELNDLQGTDYGFDDYLTESVHTGTIEVVGEDEADEDDDEEIEIRKGDQ